MADVRDATATAADVIDEVVEATGTTKAKAKEVVEKVKARLHETVETSSHKLHDTYEKVADTSLHDVGVSVKWYVRRRPGQALLIAAGAGLLAGLILRGGRR